MDKTILWTKLYYIENYGASKKNLVDYQKLRNFIL